LVNILKFFDEDLGWKKVGSGIRDKHPGSATLVVDRHRCDAEVRIHFDTDPDSDPLLP
jgi:hypothetical protein